MGARFPAAVVALALAAVTPALAQNAAPAAVEPQLAPVTIDGHILFLVRGISAYPADQRAREIQNRITAIAADRSVTPASLTVDDQADASFIMAGRQRVMAALEEDGAQEQIARATLAQAYAQRIRDAIDAWRQARAPARLWRHAAYTLGATLALFVLSYAGRHLVAWLRALIERRYESRIRDVQIQRFQVVRAKQIWAVLAGLLNLLWGLGVIVVLFVYLRYVFGLFPWTQGLSAGLLAITIGPLETLATGFIRQIPNIIFLLVLALVTRYILKLVRLFFQGVADGTVALRDFDREWAWHTYRLVRTLLIVFAVVVAYPYVPGSDSDAFKGVTLFAGLVFSLGSSSLIGNLIAGYSMIYRRAFKTGDRVKIGDHVGEVLSTRLLVTHLRTPKNEVVAVPNSRILGAEVLNYSSMARDRGLILHTTVGIGYETPWRKVEAMLLEAASRTPGLLREPAPFVLQRSLGDFAITYELNAYCDTPETMLALYTAMHRNILDVFNEYGVQIMTPAYEGDPEKPKVVPKGEWYQPPASKP
jgi:small-conductance mechanosensitive channel